MNRAIVLFPFLFLMSLFVFSQGEQGSAANIEFDKEVHDFGTIEMYSDASCVFTFKNTGNMPLVITKVVTSCGCTVPEYPKKPIMPGEEAQIQVIYTPDKVETFNNQVVVRSNAEEGVVVLKVKGTVVEKTE